ncbi:DUF859 domain-containing protein, partial [Candidatus Saccharibacteria bacterium]|nr:DUF859 domain-containing protein [Candidatus Saccharibacteria bacterium]
MRIELPDLTGTAPWRSWENPPGESLTMDLSQEDIDDLLQRMSDTNTTRLRFVVATLIGGVEQFWSFGDQVFNIVDGQPIFTDFNYRDSNNSVSAVTGNNQVLVQGLSALEVTVTAAQSMVARLFSNPNRYSFHFGATDVSASFSPTQDVIVSLGVPTAAGVDRQLTVRAIDSRGNNTPVARAINVIPYTTPEIAASVAREGGFDTQTTLSIAGMFSLVEVGGVAKNTVSSSTGVRYRMKQSASGTWGAWTGVTAMIGSDGSISVADVLINADNKQQWDFEVQIQDLFSVSTVPLTLSVGLPILFVDSRRRVGVNKMPELGDLDVSGDIYSDGGKVATIPSLMLGYAESTSVFTGGNNAVVPTEVTFTVPGGVSRVKITFWCGNAYSTLLNGGGEVIVWSGNVGSGTQLCRGRCTRSGDFGSISVTAQRVMDVMPGQTYTIRDGTWN